MNLAEQQWLDELHDDVEPWELEHFQDEAEREAAFTGELLFGTGGIRSTMGIGPARMNRITIARAAQGLADYLNSHGTEEANEPDVAIAFDTRCHSRDFAGTTASVLAANGIHVHLFKDPVPTPVLSFTVRQLSCNAGVVITASHNPMEYNGFKVYGPTGDQATDVLARGVQTCISRVDTFIGPQSLMLGEGIGQGKIDLLGDELVDSFVEAVLAQSPGVDCSNIGVVYSPLNGTGLKPAKKIFQAREIRYRLIEAQCAPDGTFPTCPKPNPENPQAMHLAMVRAQVDGADLALASDPDADRIGVAVSHGGEMRLLTGNEVALLLLDFVCQATKLPQDPVAVTTIVSSPLADEIARRNGIELRRTLTGFKYVGEQMDLLEQKGQTDRFILGFEESCGYLRGSYVRDKDASVALLLVCEMAAWHKGQGRDLVEALEDLYLRYGNMADGQVSRELPRKTMDALMSRLRQDPPTNLGDIPVVGVTDYSHGADMPATGVTNSKQTLPPSNVLEYRLEEGSKVLLRPSGTEPKVKAYVFASGNSEDEAKGKLDMLVDDVKQLLGEDNKAGEGSMLNVVLLSGGSGTRLWPLSNGARSKQFLKVLRDDEGKPESMVQRTVRLIRRENKDVNITIATSASQVDAIEMQVPKPYELSVEPERRDTAPAIMLAAANVAWKQGAEPSSTVVVMPIDTYADPAYYANVQQLDAAVQADAADIVLLGVEPTYPSEKYGYIVPKTTGSSVWPVARFTEKPDQQEARKLISQGALWNCGVFAFKLSYLLTLISYFAQETTYEGLRGAYQTLPKNSFDYEVVEKAKGVAVVPCSGTWKDLGTWNTLCEELAEPTAGRVWLDKPTCSNVHVINETDIPVVVSGMKNAVIVATLDGILVSDKAASSHIKSLVTEASQDRPMYERRRWGEYKVLENSQLEDGAETLVLSVTLNRGQQFYYQRHQYRTETWYVKSGEGKFVLDGKVNRIQAGDIVRALPGQMHALYADVDIKLVETQMGSPLDLNDIERFGCFWD